MNSIIIISNRSDLVERSERPFRTHFDLVEVGKVGSLDVLHKGGLVCFWVADGVINDYSAADQEIMKSMFGNPILYIMEFREETLLRSALQTVAELPGFSDALVDNTFYLQCLLPEYVEILGKHYCYVTADELGKKQLFVGWPDDDEPE